MYKGKAQALDPFQRFKGVVLCYALLIKKELFTFFVVNIYLFKAQ